MRSRSSLSTFSSKLSVNNRSFAIALALDSQPPRLDNSVLSLAFQPLAFFSTMLSLESHPLRRGRMVLSPAFWL